MKDKYQITREVYREYTGLVNVMTPFEKWLDEQQAEEEE